MKKKVVALSVLALTLLVSACTETTADSTDAESTPAVVQDESTSSDAVATEKQTEQPEQEEEQAVTETVYNLNDSAALKDWEISVTNMQIVDSIAADYGSFSPDESGNKYLQVFVTVTNNGKQADTFLPSYGFGDDVQAKVIYGDGYEFSSTYLLGYSNELHDSTINPLSSKTGEIAFEVPETVASSEDELVIQFISGSDVVKFKIR